VNHHHLKRPAAALAAVGLTLAGCSSHTSAPAPLTTTAAADSADVAKMDTGPYAISATHPYGTAGDDRFAQGVLESQRLAVVTVGPWQVNPKLILWGSVLNAGVTGTIPNADAMRNGSMLPGPLPDIAARNGLMAGFSTARLAPAEQGSSPLGAPKFWGLQTLVLRFPDPAAAAAAAAQLAAADPQPATATGAGQPVTLQGTPEAVARSYELSDGRTEVHAFTPHNAFVLYQSAVVGSDAPLGLSARMLVFDAVADQRRLLDSFVPTPADKLADLPLDPSGALLARTLTNPSGSIPAMVGTWTPTAWLAFEDNPPAAATILDEAGVDWGAQRLATVYQTKNADSATAMLTKVVDGLRRTEGAKPAAPVPGLPQARCFERGDVEGLQEAAQSWQRIAWRFKCAAATGRYVFTVYAADGRDAQQRISAQWRILAGK